MLLLEWAFGAWFSKAGEQVSVSWSNSLGYGVLYIIGLPILIALAFMIVIGIPVGLVALVFYIFTMVFGNFVGALVFTHLYKDRSNKKWSVFLTSLIAFLGAVVLHLLTSIPFIGFLISFGVLSITYGAIILAIRKRREGRAPVVEAA